MEEDHLVSFAQQVANGMAYLTSKRFLHRDFYARNVLIYLIKIADFGMCKDLADFDYYRKQTNGLLPLQNYFWINFMIVKVMCLVFFFNYY